MLLKLPLSSIREIVITRGHDEVSEPQISWELASFERRLSINLTNPSDKPREREWIENSVESWGIGYWFFSRLLQQWQSVSIVERQASVGSFRERGGVRWTLASENTVHGVLCNMSNCCSMWLVTGRVD